MLTNTYVLGCEKVAGFYCEKCDVKCSKKWLYDRHLNTSKHKNTYNDLPKKCYACEDCGKEYIHRQSLHTHKQKCTPENTSIVEPDQVDLKTLDMNLIMQLLKQNDEIKSLMVEQNNKMMETIQELCKNIAKEVTIDKTTT